MGIAPMYLTEIAPVKYRGVFGTLGQFGVVTSILLSQVSKCLLKNFRAVDSGLFPSQVKLMTVKLVFTASLFDAQH